MARIPQRNLPPNAEIWGRSVDERIEALERATTQNAQNVGTSFSNINGNLGAMGRQMALQVWGGYVTDQRTGFGVASSGWVNNGYGAILWPDRATSAYVLATGIGSPVQSTSGTGTDYLAYGRLNINGQVSPEVPGIPFAVGADNISLVQTSWSAFVKRETEFYEQINIGLELRAPNPSWYPYNAASKMQISAIVMFNADPNITDSQANF